MKPAPVGQFGSMWYARTYARVIWKMWAYNGSIQAYRQLNLDHTKFMPPNGGVWGGLPPHERRRSRSEYARSGQDKRRTEYVYPFRAFFGTITLGDSSPPGGSILSQGES